VTFELGDLDRTVVSLDNWYESLLIYHTTAFIFAKFPK
jgi:hypothetical protein